MKALVCKQWGDPDTLTVEEMESKAPAAGEVTIRVHACGVNFADTLMIQGLYQVKPLQGECVPLLEGDAIKGAEPGGTVFGLHNPVAWTKQRKQGRTFFTTLGHPEDFEQEAVRRLLINGIYWALGKEIPAGGTNADVQGKAGTSKTSGREAR